MKVFQFFFCYVVVVFVVVGVGFVLVHTTTATEYDNAISKLKMQSISRFDAFHAIVRFDGRPKQRMKFNGCQNMTFFAVNSISFLLFSLPPTRSSSLPPDECLSFQFRFGFILLLAALHPLFKESSIQRQQTLFDDCNRKYHRAYARLWIDRIDNEKSELSKWN